MNEIRRKDRDAEEIARIREIVGRHAFPSFVRGFDVELGEFDGEPAMWIIFHTVGSRPSDMEARKQRAYAMRALWQGVHRDLLAEIEGRYPYYRFANTEADIPATP